MRHQCQFLWLTICRGTAVLLQELVKKAGREGNEQQQMLTVVCALTAAQPHLTILPPSALKVVPSVKACLG